MPRDEGVPKERRPVSERLVEEAFGLPGQLEEHKGNRAGQLSMRLFASLRLVIEPAHAPIPTKPDGGLDRRRVTAIRIVEVVDSHE